MSFSLRAAIGTVLLFPAFLIAAEPAEARRGVSGTRQVLQFVSDTDLTDADGAGLSLCLLVEETTALFILNLGIEMEGYVVAPDRCTGDAYYDYPIERFAVDKAIGNIPGDVPDTPTLTTSQKVTGNSGWLVLLGLIAFGVVAKFRKTGDSSRKRDAMLQVMAPLHRSATVVMAHAAQADGKVEASEAAMMGRNLQDFLRVQVNIDQVAAVLHMTQPDQLRGDLKSIAGAGHSQDERVSLVTIAVMMVASDGNVDGKELSFVRKLTKALKVSDAELNGIVDRVMGQRGSAAPA